MKSFTTLFPISCLREHVLFSWWLFLWVSQGRRRTSDMSPTDGDLLQLEVDRGRRRREESGNFWWRLLRISCLPMSNLEPPQKKGEGSWVRGLFVSGGGIESFRLLNGNQESFLIWWGGRQTTGPPGGRSVGNSCPKLMLFISPPEVMGTKQKQGSSSSSAAPPKRIPLVASGGFFIWSRKRICCPFHPLPASTD